MEPLDPNCLDETAHGSSPSNQISCKYSNAGDGYDCGCRESTTMMVAHNSEVFDDGHADDAENMQ